MLDFESHSNEAEFFGMKLCRNKMWLKPRPPYYHCRGTPLKKLLSIQSCTRDVIIYSIALKFCIKVLCNVQCNSIIFIVYSQKRENVLYNWEKSLYWPPRGFRGNRGTPEGVNISFFRKLYKAFSSFWL